MVCFCVKDALFLGILFGGMFLSAVLTRGLVITCIIGVFGVRYSTYTAV